MPVYEYEHVAKKCARGKRFEVRQGIDGERLSVCPDCGQDVRRVFSRVFVNTPRTNSELKGMGFTKLVRRDKGVYENVTAGGRREPRLGREQAGDQTAVAQENPGLRSAGGPSSPGQPGFSNSPRSRAFPAGLPPATR